VNRLADATSPYLRQHRDNPVDWYQWGDEAFARARAEDKPVLLSVGYSACHWCHVMAHESFEDAGTAAVMNDLFVSVKVDREERPDVDAIYMAATQAMTGQGGWPMTVFCTPDGRPFYCGTYFPNQPRHGLPGFVDLCRAIDDAWRNRRDDILGNAEELTEAVSRSALGTIDPSNDLPGTETLTAAYRQLREQHDDDWGGFGAQPKFPQTISLELLLRAHQRNHAPQALATVETSLEAMASGGIYDHLGGGFARYSVDRIWLVPHFEKMLYDQALLARIYLHAWQVTGSDVYRQVLDETIGYVLRDLRHPVGGFYSAEDADSEGVEGKFYVWTSEEIRAALREHPGLADAAVEWYGVTDEGNFEGHNILSRIAHLGDLMRPPDVEEARARLFEARVQRVRPGLDDKVLTEWNALFLTTLAEAAAATGRDDWLDAARACGEFLLRELRRSDGRWLRAWQEDHGAHTLAFAADHAAVVEAFTRLGEATGEARWILAAVDAADSLLELFWDDDGYGLFTIGSDGEPLITRSKDLLDDATPSANSMAAVGLVRLAALTGVDRYRDRAEEIVRLLGTIAGQHPTAFAHLLGAVDLLDAGVTEIAVVGDRDDLVRVAQRRYLPNAVIAWGQPYESPLWAERRDGYAYVCRDFVCAAPVENEEALAAQLS
jgi:uncharacterized protein YyaL (SSP411 family)